MKKTLFMLLLVCAVSFVSADNITPVRTDVSGFPSWTDTSVAGTTYLQLLVAGANTISPAMNFDNYTAETLDFKARTYGGTNAVENTVTVAISTNDGSSWADLGTRTPTTNSLTAMTQFDLSGYSGTQVKIRFMVAGTSNSIGIGIDDITIAGTPLLASPVIDVSIATLTGFTYEYGNGPSSEQSFTISGTDLTANISIDAPTNYQISTGTGAAFDANMSDPITLTQSGGTVGTTTIYVRLISNLAIGAYNGEVITASSTGASDQTVTCSGSVTAPPPPDEPVANTVVSIGSDNFTASWDAVSGATGYYLDVYTIEPGVNATDLFISEYLEGSSNNKYIEVFNGTGSSIDLSDYKLQLYSNGATSPTSDVTLSGTLDTGDCVVYRNSGAVLTLPDGVTATINAAVNFNGDDAVALYKISTSSFVDIFGWIGTPDPGTQWGTSPLWTINTTLVRKSSVYGGVTTNPVTEDFPTLATEWDYYAQDTATYLGSHTMAGGSTLTYVSGFENLDVENVTSYLVTGLAPETTYFYRVRAYNDYGTSDNSNEIEVTTDDEPLPVELSSFTAVISATNYVNLTWVTQTETGVQGYYIYRAASSQLINAEMVSSMIAATNTSQQQSYVFTDSDIYETGTYYYWLQNVDFDGSNTFHGPVSVYYSAEGNNPTPDIPLVTQLNSIYPNPFNPSTFIPFSIATSSDVSFKIYNSRGQIVKHYDLGSKVPGNYRIEWNGTDYNGQPLANGVYYVKMLAGRDSYQAKAVLLK